MQKSGLFYMCLNKLLPKNGNRYIPVAVFERKIKQATFFDVPHKYLWPQKIDANIKLLGKKKRFIDK